MLLIVIAGVLIPLAVAVAILSTGRWRDDPKKIVVLSLCSVLCPGIAALVGWLGIRNQTFFKEVWHFKNIEVRYYEPWDERVSCRHPIYVTMTRTVGSGKDMRTETYQQYVGDQHPYDVDFHPDQWAVADERGAEHEIEHGDYDHWKAVWGGKSRFVDMHRSFHSINGNCWSADWNYDPNTIYPRSEIHSYENRVRVSRSVFTFKEVDESVKKRFPRPADEGRTDALFCYGVPFDASLNASLNRLNAELGPSKKIHMIVILFDASQDTPAVIEDVKGAWKGANKNELVTALGINSAGEVAWADCFSWMSDTTIHGMIRQELAGKYDAAKIVSVLRENVTSRWEKKSFKDFDYLSTELGGGWVALSFALTILLTAGVTVWLDVTEF